MSQTAKDVLNRIPTWPHEDQEELAEVAREIEARRTGVHVLDDDENGAIDAARRTGIASDADVAALWKRHGIA
jgi:hypothetical protein